MAAEPTLSAILQAIEGLSARLGSLEAKTDGVSARLGSLEAKIEASSARLGSLEAKIEASSARLGSLEAKIEASSARLGSLEAEVKDIRAHLKAQPDLRLMFANGKVTLEKIVEIEGEIRMLRSAINDHARENVTPGEMEAVHHDLALIRHEQLASAARLQRIEAVLNLEPNG